MVAQTFSLETFETFLLILTRIGTFIFIAPFFSQRGVPNMTKLGLAGVLSVMMVYLVDAPNTDYSSAFGYGILVIREATAGLLIGYGANIVSYIINFAGNIIDMDIGLSMATEFDPNTSTQVTVTGSLYNQFIMLLLIVSNMYQYMLKALVDSFSVVPIGEAQFRTNVLLKGMIVYFTDLFVIGFRIMMPVFATIMILNCVLGVMAKVAPQMNMFSIGVQLKVMTGLLVIYVMIFLFPQAADLVFDEMRLQMANMLDGLH